MGHTAKAGAANCIYVTLSTPCHSIFFKIIIIIFISIYYILLWWTVSIGIKKKSDDVWGNQAHLISNLSEPELHKISSS